MIINQNFPKEYYSYNILYENLIETNSFHLELEQAKDKDLSYQNSILNYYLNISQFQENETKKFPFELNYNKENHLLELILIDKINVNEIERKYLIELIVIDGQNEKDCCLIEINIEENQFFSPIFTQKVYKFNINNSNEIFSSLGQVKAKNHLNKIKKEKINYRLISSLNSNLFKINETSGDIYFNNQFSLSSLNNFYDLLVESYYLNSISSLTNVFIYFNFDFNLNYLKEKEKENENLIQILIPKLFQNYQNSNEISLKENSSIPLTILQVFISSSSSSSSLSKLEMNSSINIKNYFNLKQLDEESYELILIKSIDYEFIQNISLDFIFNLNQKSIQIFIQNINDCLPIFNQSNFFFQINENNQIPFLLHTFQAFDQDQLDHLTYQLEITGYRSLFIQHLSFLLLLSFLDDKQSFEINSTTGELWILKSFDRELKSNYSFLICVFDQLYRTCSTVYLDIIDQNDNNCTFNSSILILSIQENLLPFTNITQIKAFDLDYQYQSIYYQFSSKTPYLNINSKTGLIQTTSISFDYELIQNYSIDIIGCDNFNSFPSFCCSIKFILNIIDLNDNKPFLIYPSSLDQIFIINYTNKTMPQLKAFDNDIFNPLIFFSIIDGSLNSSISIDYYSGQLYLLPSTHLPLYGTLLISISSQTIIHLTILIHDNQTNPYTYLMLLQQQQSSSSSLFTYSHLFYFISFIFFIFLLLIIIILIYCFIKKQQKSRNDNDRLMNTPSTTTLSTKSISTSNNKKLYETYYSFGDSVSSPQVIYL